MASNNTNVYVPCTLQTCAISEAPIPYQPNLGANAVFLAVFAGALVIQLGLGIGHRTWSYLIGMGGGLILEIAGYAGRIQLHANPFVFNSFVQMNIYLVCLTVAPAFISAVIYLCFYRITLIYGHSLLRLKSRTLAWIFIISDIVCLVLQAAGGAITAMSGGTSKQAEAGRKTGINIMIAGLALQVVSLLVFLAGALYYMCSVHLKGLGPGPVVLHSRSWNGFLISLAIAILAIFIRSIYRVAELREGFQSGLAGNEIAFMILEGAMIVIATICLTAFHPGYCLGVPRRVQTTGPDFGLGLPE